jgi:hypothetical protein
MVLRSPRGMEVAQPVVRAMDARPIATIRALNLSFIVFLLLHSICFDLLKNFFF